MENALSSNVNSYKEKPQKEQSIVHKYLCELFVTTQKLLAHARHFYINSGHHMLKSCLIVNLWEQNVKEFF